jgi:proline iminopeptidase
MGSAVTASLPSYQRPHSRQSTTGSRRFPGAWLTAAGDTRSPALDGSPVAVRVSSPMYPGGSVDHPERRHPLAAGWFRAARAARGRLAAQIAAAAVVSGCTERTADLPDGVEAVEIGGVDQAIYVTGDDPTAPVVLVLHGGPGYAMLPLFHEQMPELEQAYTIVNWDQRGAGLSYADDLDAASMTFDQAVDDAHALTLYLEDRFDADQLYLVGHSWGTMLGTELIQRYPEDYAAYIGTGQVANVVQNEQGSYDFALAMAHEDGNTEAIDALEAVGRPDDDGEYATEDGPDVTMAWVGYYGGDVYGADGADAIDTVLLESSVYADFNDEWLAGVAFSQAYFADPAVWAIDFPTTHTDLSVPVALFMGRHDYDTPAPLAEAYFDAIDAPDKRLVWFESSAHFPFYEESSKFSSELQDFFQ